MQQTEIYQLNKIGMDDHFSPDPINENTEKLEAALAGMEDRLGQRITTLEGHRLASGTYRGTYTGTTTNSSLDQTFELGFTPAVVFIFSLHYGSSPGMALPDNPVSRNSREVLRIIPGGFYVADDLNQSIYYYNYLALL